MVLVRLLVGLLKGLAIGALAGYGLARAGFAMPGAFIGYAAAAVLGAVLACLAGKPIWAKGASVEVGMKALTGVIIAPLLLIAVRRWLTYELPFESAGAARDWPRLGQGHDWLVLRERVCGGRGRARRLFRCRQRRCRSPAKPSSRQSCAQEDCCVRHVQQQGRRRRARRRGRRRSPQGREVARAGRSRGALLATAAALALAVRSAVRGPPPLAVALGALAAYLLLVLLGVLLSRFGMFADVLARGPRGARGVALTFDDGPDPATTPRVLAMLKGAGATATFFVIGHKAERYPDPNPPHRRERASGRPPRLQPRPLLCAALGAGYAGGIGARMPAIR